MDGAWQVRPSDRLKLDRNLWNEVNGPLRIDLMWYALLTVQSFESPLLTDLDEAKLTIHPEGGLGDPLLHPEIQILASS